MLNKTLTLLEEILPPEELHAKEEGWEHTAHLFTEELALIIDQLFKTVALTFPRRVLDESKQEYLISRVPTTVVAEFRLRPEASYYTRMHRRLPRPEDKSGDDATGLQVSAVLCRGYASGTLVRRPFFSVDFEVWGVHERERFGKLLRDHQYMVEQLVNSSPATFSTSCVFENLACAHRASAFEKLVLYYENPQDDENTFSLQSEFDANATEADITFALLPMIALYDACMGYCLPSQKRDRLLEHIGLIQK